MGTRADFYIQPGAELSAAKYLGSTAWDGYPDGVDLDIREATTIETFVAAVTAYFSGRDDVSLPEQHGWPWPWENSNTTDYAYVLNESTGEVDIYSYGSLVGEDGNEDSNFPDMRDTQNVRLDAGSGLIIL